MDRETVARMPNLSSRWRRSMPVFLGANVAPSFQVGFRRRQAFAGLFLLLACSSDIVIGASEVGPPSILLSPNQPLNNLEISPYGGQLLVKFRALRPNTEYDLKISYPGVTPIQFFFVPQGQVNIKRRRLLDTEKYGFMTESTAKSINPILLLAKPTGVSYSKRIERRPVRFNIVLESKRFGIPSGTFRLIFVVVFGILFAVVGLRNILKTYLVSSTRVQSGDEAPKRS